MSNVTTLQITDGKLGTGASATAGRDVTVHFDVEPIGVR